MISGKTTILGVMGDPISHSLSPYLHNGVARKLGLDFCYVPFHVKPDDLQDAVAGLKGLGIAGFNVTVPHKASIMVYLDDCDEEALAMGAVNTVVNRKGVLQGYNTDGKGFLYALKRHHYDITGKHVVFLGSGGTAKALAYMCLSQHVGSLSILNRTLDNASLLKESLLRLSPDATIQAFQRDDLASLHVLNQADLIINVTSLGLSQDDDLPVMNTDWFRSGQCLFDVIYNPTETRFLSLGRAFGLNTINGLSMLVAQAAYAFELFTDQEAPFDAFFSMLDD